MSRNEGPPDWAQSPDSPSQRTTRDHYLPSRQAFPSSVVTGVKIIAWLMLLNTGIGAGLVVVSMFTPEGSEVLSTSGNRIGTEVTLADYLTPVRVLIATTIGIAFSIMIWKAVDQGD